MIPRLRLVPMSIGLLICGAGLAARTASASQGPVNTVTAPAVGTPPPRPPSRRR